MERIRINQIIQSYPKLLTPVGSYVNTLKLLFNKLPRIEILNDMITGIYKGTIYDFELSNNNIIMNDENGVTSYLYNLDEILTDLKIDIQYNYYINEDIKLYEDIVAYDNNVYTLYDLMLNTEYTDIIYEIINSLPLINHNRIIYTYNKSDYIGINKIDMINTDIEYNNIKLYKTKNGYVIGNNKYPFSMFHNYTTNIECNSILGTDVPCIDNNFFISSYF